MNYYKVYKFGSRGGEEDMEVYGSDYSISKFANEFYLMVVRDYYKLCNSPEDRKDLTIMLEEFGYVEEISEPYYGGDGYGVGISEEESYFIIETRLYKID